jgi:hypothetical protein
MSLGFCFSKFLDIFPFLSLGCDSYYRFSWKPETGNPPPMYHEVPTIFIMVGFATWIMPQGQHLKIENALYCHLPGNRDSNHLGWTL